MYLTNIACNKVYQIKVFLKSVGQSWHWGPPPQSNPRSQSTIVKTCHLIINQAHQHDKRNDTQAYGEH